MSEARRLGIIFDCDGVLIDSEGLASRVEAELTRELGLDLTSPRRTTCSSARPSMACSTRSPQRSRRALPARFAYNWAFATAHAFMRELQPMPDVHAVDRSAAPARSRNGGGIAVAAGARALLARRDGTGAIFGEHVYVTSMVPRPKPAPDIYLLAAARLGAAPAGLRGGRGLARPARRRRVAPACNVDWLCARRDA